jgi:hypothetical protein
LSRARIAAFVALLAVVVTYDAVSASLPDLSHPWDVALLTAVVTPITLALLMPILPLWRMRPSVLLGATAALGVLAIACEVADFWIAANLAKLFCYAFFGWWALSYFEELWWVVLVALVIPIADSASVFSSQGPTNKITEHHIDWYVHVAVRFVVPDRGASFVGPPDIIFYALFLAAAARFGLRVWTTFVAMMVGLAATFLIAEKLSVDGLPALVGISLAFLLPNADLIWRQVRSAARSASARASE